ncbi:MAG TPA: DUF2585 family protein [Xanthobacteraceae bacterium]|nr:DUF2585 family protein [Xanthobacteraceae bacterium]
MKFVDHGAAGREKPGVSDAGNTRDFVLVAVSFTVMQAVVLYLMGQPPICTCGTLKLWVGAVNGPENSQQFTDWYSFSHFIHGIIFYFVLWLIFPRTSLGLRFALAIGLEAGWEMLENTPFIIGRYRQSALANGYSGDSIVNSLSDTLIAVGGFAFARLAPAWASAALILALESFVGFMIRDNLTLNIIQLIHPSKMISLWQMNGHMLNK